MWNNFVNKLKGWWHKMFDYNKIITDFGLDLQTSKNILETGQIFLMVKNHGLTLRQHHYTLLKQYVKK